MDSNISKLNQLTINNELTAITVPKTGSKRVVSQICISNVSRSTDSYVTIYAYGNTSNNIIFPKVKVASESHICILEDNFVLPLIDDEALYAKTDSSNKVLITVFGTEVV